MSGKTAVATIAMRIDAGIQATDGLGPDDHLTVATSLTHPVARPPFVPTYVHIAIEKQIGTPTKVFIMCNFILFSVLSRWLLTQIIASS